MGMERRTVVKGAAWSLPVIAAAVAAPAAVASDGSAGGCVPVRMHLDWAGDYRRTSATAGSAAVGGAESTIALTVTQAGIGANTRTGNQTRTQNLNLAVSSFAVGGTASAGLAIHQSPISNSRKAASTSSAARIAENSQTIRFDFSEPVDQLSFLITDIDAAAYDYFDRVVIESGAAFTASSGSGSIVEGSGTAADPLRAGRIEPVPENSGRANATVSFLEPVSSFSLTYQNVESRSDLRIDGDQAIFLSALSFTTTC